MEHASTYNCPFCGKPCQFTITNRMSNAGIRRCIFCSREHGFVQKKNGFTYLSWRKRVLLKPPPEEGPKGKMENFDDEVPPWGETTQ